MSVDGFIGGPNGEMNWLNMNWDEKLIAFITELTESMDTIIMGRKLAEGFIPYWAGVAADAANPEHEAGKIFTNTKKVVFSKTLERSAWDRTELAKGDLTEEVNRLKAQSGKDIIVYGGAAFVSSLIKAGLIDELNLLVNPTAIGNGLPIFKELTAKQELKLVKAQAFECGIALMQYAKK